MTIYERIKELRKQNNWTQIELAKKIGYETAGAINKIENGQRDINQETVKKFADVFNVSFNYLLTGEEKGVDEEYKDYIDELRTRPELKLLFSVTKGCGKEDIERAVKIIEALKQNNG